MRPPRASQSDVSVFVPPEVVFPGITADERTLVELLGTLNRNETLIACCRANTAVSGYAGLDYKAQQERMITDCLPLGAAERINHFIRERRLSYTPPVFFRGQLLELLRWAAKHAKDDPAVPDFYNDFANRVTFGKAALIAGMIWSRRVYADRLRTSGDPDLDRLRALGPFRKGVEESAHAPNQAQTLGRGWLLFTKHMPERYPQFDELFEKATGLTVRQYLITTAGLSVFTKSDANPLATFSASKMAGESAYKEIVPRYLALQSQTADDLMNSLWGSTFAVSGYRSLRERPLIAGRDDRMAIVDPIFLSEKISVGPLFHVIASVSKKKANEVFGAFGLAFEDYAGGMLERIYPKRDGLVPLLERNVKLGDLEIDAELTNMDKTALIEIKAAWLREDAILDDSPDRLVDNLKSLYGVSNKEGERPKGVAQLARFINEIFANPKAPDAQRYANTRIFHPVLLVHDVSLSAPAFGNFLDKEFKKLLNVPPKGKYVMGLTVMTVDDLEKLETSVTNFALLDLLTEYNAAVPDRIQTLHNFALRSSFGHLFLPNKPLIETSNQVIDVALRELFPEFKEVKGKLD